ncbi:MAG: hypothetical protein A2Y00_10375 [Omnitrophica WOR_2 bacterium GWF2_43_52]|nr:MAG: hypothetical protein A2062_02650 [Omnitrophica WOR_2 bacterium GWA2_44_7]OGX21872.1 MAG: hypothetical protein A2Y00_10375 [Omnitrophica WOR_2 bacterium GWF2_43_52]OGX58830.1 MAG: hypothetical protein A2460_04490 [Omnitrophica WOR_2 bacterium RIFOXYC2_FULL_43_9]HAH20191.1 response regulator [Candidatus Omnitrophota bacterium]HBG63029.1 response regulator [Candidatus Omnitrophota bacterium]
MDKPKILLVDDEPDARDIIERHLCRHIECSVYNAQDGRQALELIGKENFDVAILDVKMPGISGIDVLRKLKEVNPQVGVLVVSGWNSQQVAQAAINEGAVDYIIKPSNMEVIFSKVRALLEKINKYFPKAEQK